MNIRLLLWLVLMSLASGACTAVSLGALVMTPMMFTSRKVMQDPNAWLFIGAIVVSIFIFLALLALQWILFALKKNQAAFIVSLHPLVAYGIYTAFFGTPTDFSGRYNTLSSEQVWPTQVVRFQVHAPNLSSDAGLHVYLHTPMDTTGPFGTPLRPVSGGNWELTTVLPRQHYLYMYNLGDWRHQALQHDGHPRHNTWLQLKSDTTMYDTIPGWLDQPPPPRHVSPLNWDHGDTVNTGKEVLPVDYENTEEAP